MFGAFCGSGTIYATGVRYGNVAFNAIFISVFYGPHFVVLRAGRWVGKHVLASLLAIVTLAKLRTRGVPTIPELIIKLAVSRLQASCVRTFSTLCNRHNFGQL